MEGYLFKWVNVLKRWQPRYFILNDDILTYCEIKGGPPKGQIHLKISSIMLVVEDPLGWIMDTGTSEIHLRARTIVEKVQWVNELKKTQEKCMQQNGNYISNQEYNRIYSHTYNDCLADIWVTQAQFEETLSLLKPKLEKNSNVRELIKKLEELGKTLKNKITLCTQMLEDEKKRGSKLRQNNENITPEIDFQDQNNQQSDYKSIVEENGTIYGSFDQGSNQSPNQPNMNLNGLRRQKSRTDSQHELQIPMSVLLEEIKDEQPTKYKSLIKNDVFKNQLITNAKSRDKLPRTSDPKQKLNIWKLLKDLIGKDLSKFAVPVQLNEPLSMLQRLSEQLEYYQFLQIANKEQDSCLRMCYVMGFAVSAYAGSINRTKKPFNPILGETFDISHNDFKFISEQVSHHPPISAGFASSQDFEMWAHTALKSNFKGKSLEVRPLGSTNLILKQFNDHFTYTKCITHVKNILFGEMYIDNYGDMNFSNNSTLDNGVLTLKQKGSRIEDSFLMNGIIKNSLGEEKYHLSGRWDDQLVAINCATKKQTVVWKRHTLPPNHENYYYFTNFALQLNHLSADLIKTIPCTDCRLRPDQQALELGMMDVAASEKLRLEEKQRARRKLMSERKETHVPRYFTEQIDPITQEQIYVYNQKYWDLNLRRSVEGYDLF